MADYIIRVTAGDGSIRGFFANTKEAVGEAVKIHGTSPVVSAAFGRLLTAGAIMGCMLKGDDLLTLTIKGNGPAKGLLVTAGSDACVKGYVHEPLVDMPLKLNGKLDVSGALGEGMLGVLKDMGLKEPYIGQIPLVSGEIAEDLTYYFAKSEQVPTSVALGVLVDIDWTIKQSGGFIVQLMPEASEKIISMLEKNLEKIDSVTNMLDDGSSIEDIYKIVFNGLDAVENERIPVKYHCNCDKERVKKALISIGRKELEDIYNEGKAEMHCHFCNKDYFFSKAELKEILLGLE